MSPASPQDEYNRQILSAIASGEHITQRSLSARLGVALGLTNLLVKRLVAKGYVRVSRLGTRHVRYLMTATGWEALGSATRLSLENTIHLYTETREVIYASLSAASGRCRPDHAGIKRVLFYGAGDVAEIAYIGLQRTDLSLVGVVDDHKSGRFFGLPIQPSHQLSERGLGDVAFGQIIVASVRHADAIAERLTERQVPSSLITFL